MLGKGLDMSFGHTSVDYATMPRWGYGWLFRYLSPDNQLTHGKILTKPELDLIKSIPALDLFVNWEWYSTRASEGVLSGAEDGRTCHAMMVALGLPSGMRIIVSDDTGGSSYPAVLAYLRAFQLNCPGYEVIPYTRHANGERWYADTGLPYWLPVAWLNGASYVGAHCMAFQNGNQAYGNAADENLIFDTTGSLRHAQHNPVPTPQPIPVVTSKGTFVKDYLVSQGLAVFIVKSDFSSKSLVRSAADVATLLRTGQYIVTTLSDVQLASIPKV